MLDISIVLGHCYNFMKKAIYPGTFDPMTNGHLDVLERSCRMFDEVVVVVAENNNKAPLFTAEERVSLIGECIENEKLSNASVASINSELTVDYACNIGAIAIIRGLRAISDFEFEFQMAQMNRILNEKIETVFFMPNEEFFFTSSWLVKHVSEYEIDRISKLIPEPVQKALRAKLHS